MGFGGSSFIMGRLKGEIEVGYCTFRFGGKAAKF